MAKQSTPPPSRLLALPRELRDIILFYAVVEPDPIPCTRYRYAQVYSPPLTRTCSQLRTETLEICYTQNEFAFQNLEYAAPFLGGLRKREGLGKKRCIHLNLGRNLETDEPAPMSGYVRVAVSVDQKLDVQYGNGMFCMVCKDGVDDVVGDIKDEYEAFSQSKKAEDGILCVVQCLGDAVFDLEVEIKEGSCHICGF